MAVKFTKPEVNVREKLVELDKPSGIAGEAMLRADTVAEQQALIGVGRRNLIINGSMQVAQRGTTFGSTYNNAYTLDRWKARRYAANNYYTTQENADAEDPFLYYVKVRRNTGDTSTGALSLTQRIEPINFKAYRGRTVTLSFWYRTGASFSPQYFRASILGSTDTSATLSYWAYSSGVIAKQDTQIEPSTTWKQHTITYMIPSNAEQLAIAFGVETPYNWAGTAGSDDSFQVANVQLEEGKVATPFEHRSYGEELALCQRYYYKRAATVNGDRFCSGNASSTTDFRGFIEFPVEMRASPTFETSGTASHFSIVTGTNGVVTCNDIPTAGLQKWGGLINAETASGLTAGHGGQLRAASTSAYIAASAEL